MTKVTLIVATTALVGVFVLSRWCSEMQDDVTQLMRSYRR